MKIRDPRKSRFYARNRRRQQSWKQASLIPAVAVGVVIAAVCVVAYFMF